MVTRKCGETEGIQYLHAIILDMLFFDKFFGHTYDVCDENSQFCPGRLRIIVPIFVFDIFEGCFVF